MLLNTLYYLNAIFQVGQEIPLFKDKQSVEGVLFEAIEDNGGFLIISFIPNLTNKENEILKTSKITAKIIKENSFILPLIRFGNSPLIFELDLDPTLYKDERAIQLENRIINFINVDSKDNSIKSIRIENMPEKLKQTLSFHWNIALNQNNYSNKYLDWKKNIYKYSILQLWNQAEYIGQFKE